MYIKWAGTPHRRASHEHPDGCLAAVGVLFHPLRDLLESGSLRSALSHDFIPLPDEVVLA